MGAGANMLRRTRKHNPVLRMRPVANTVPSSDRVPESTREYQRIVIEAAETTYQGAFLCSFELGKRVGPIQDVVRHHLLLLSSVQFGDRFVLGSVPSFVHWYEECEGPGFVVEATCEDACEYCTQAKGFQGHKGVLAAREHTPKYLLTLLSLSTPSSHTTLTLS